MADWKNKYKKSPASKRKRKGKRRGKRWGFKLFGIKIF